MLQFPVFGPLNPPKLPKTPKHPKNLNPKPRNIPKPQTFQTPRTLNPQTSQHAPMRPRRVSFVQLAPLNACALRAAFSSPST